ncbi:radical SAM family heme chaperone HemW [Entomobacter blattae]|nr:radical SAM family heme chaperone HemW [Entomobacter blattae]
MFPSAPSPTFGLYIHWPFCLSKCPYCDFNSHVWADIPYDRMANALKAELQSYTPLMAGRKLRSLFFGGGTPSLMPPHTVESLIEAAYASFSTTDMVEITLEANPTSAETEKLRAFKAAGINRLSIGVQSLIPEELTRLGRTHNVQQARAALETANRFFARYSFDLIYARPHQSLQDWQEELSMALTLAGDHLSLYQLTIEPNTAYASLHRQGKLTLPDDEQAAAFYRLTDKLLAAQGFFPYEISNYARPKGESLHNLGYWHYHDYIGIGPGAHGRLTLPDGHIYATRSHRSPQHWLENMEQRGKATRQNTPLTAHEKAEEMLLMGLRLQKGINGEEFLARTGLALTDLLNPSALQACLEEGYLTMAHNQLAPTLEGRLRLEAILAALLG